MLHIHILENLLPLGQCDVIQFKSAGAYCTLEEMHCTQLLRSLAHLWRQFAHCKRLEGDEGCACLPLAHLSHPGGYKHTGGTLDKTTYVKVREGVGYTIISYRTGQANLNINALHMAVSQIIL